MGARASNLLVNSAEGRLRAGWRLPLALSLIVLVLGPAAIAFDLVLGLTPASGLLALGGVIAAVWILYGTPVATVAVLALYLDRRPLVGVGLGGPQFARNLAVGLALGVGMTTTVFLVLWPSGLVSITGTWITDPDAPLVPLAGLGDATVGALGPLSVIAGLAAFHLAVGVAEEVVVRGYLLTNVADGLDGIGPIDSRGAILVATVVTGALFGLLHLTNPAASLRSAATITAVGVVLGWTYVVSGDLGLPIGIHVTWNLTLSALYGFPVSGLFPPASVLDVAVSGDPVVTGGAFGPEAGLVMVLPLTLAVLTTAWWVRRTTGSASIKPEIARFDPSGTTERPGRASSGQPSTRHK